MSKKSSSPHSNKPSSEAAYVPLARKYRPQTFDELTGQAHVTTTLARAIESNRVGQAYLFAGQRGVGKTSAARILARGLNCAKGPTASPCQRCPSCLALAQGTSLDVIEIDGASNRGIDDIRQLREQVKLAPVLGASRIYIIDEVHQITPDAFNALLKTLEEPPPHVKFIFATTAPQKVPATILSRCQRFDFRRLDVPTIVEALRRVVRAESLSVDDAALYAIARASDGSLRDAEVTLDQLASFADGAIREQEVVAFLGSIEHDAVLAWTQALIDHDAKAALTILAEQRRRGKEVLPLLMSLLAHLRNLLIVRTLADARMAEGDRNTLRRQLIEIPDEQLAAVERQAATLRAEEWLMVTQLLAGAYELTRRSPFADTILEMALMKIATRESWASLEELVTRLERLSAAAPFPSPALGSSTSVATPTVGHGPRETALVAPRSEPNNAPRESASVELEAVARQWPTVLEKVGQHKMSLAAYLAQGKPIQLVGHRLQIGLPGFALHQEVLNLAENLRVVERSIHEVIGHAVQIDYLRLPDPPPEPAASTTQPADLPAADVPPLVQDIVNLFDAKVVAPQPPRASHA